MALSEFTITDKDVSQIQSGARAALEELVEVAPLGRDGKKVTTPGIRALQKILVTCQSLFESAGPEPKDEAAEIKELEALIEKNEKYLTANPRATMAVRRSCENAIEAARDRLFAIKGIDPADVEEGKVLEPTF